jgi:hypothetical protein
MVINLNRFEMELVERCLRFFFCRCDDPKLESKTDKAFDLALEFENLLNKTNEENNEAFIDNNFSINFNDFRELGRSF